jgi:hypothetical protein
MMGMMLAALESATYSGMGYKVDKVRPKSKGPLKPVIPKGAKVYVIDGIEVIAINQKNAERKVAKIKLNQQTLPG